MSHVSIVTSSHRRSRASEALIQKETPKQESQPANQDHASIDNVPSILEPNTIVIKEETDPSALDKTQPLESQLQDESIVHIAQENQERGEFQIQEDSETNEKESADDGEYSDEFVEESLESPDK